MRSDTPASLHGILQKIADIFGSIHLSFGFLTILVSCPPSHSIYFSKERNYFIYGPKSIILVTMNKVQTTLICLRNSNNTSSF